jgi:hypothetical protein
MARRKKKAPRPPDVLRKGGPMKDKTKYDRKRDKDVPKSESESKAGE